MTSNYLLHPDPTGLNCTDDQEITCLTVCLCVEKSSSFIEVGVIVPAILAGILCVVVILYANYKYKIGSYSMRWGDKSAATEGGLATERVTYVNWEDNYELETMDESEGTPKANEVEEGYCERKIVNGNLPEQSNAIIKQEEQTHDDGEKVVQVHREDSKASECDKVVPSDVRWDEELRTAVDKELTLQQNSEKKAEKTSNDDRD